MSNAKQVIQDQHPDWKIFNDKAEKAVLFSNFAYRQEDEQMQELASQMPKGYEIFLMTDHVEEVGKSSFRCVAFLNEESKEVVFATAGSRFGVTEKGLSDVIDDALMIGKNQPLKMDPAQILNDMVLDSLGDQAKNYKFHYTGHSLGAAMAEMQAVDMDIKLIQKGLKQEGPAAQEQISAVTFENPGSKPMVEKMYKKAGLPAQEHMEKLNFCEFNNRSNMINSLNEQTGRTYTIVPHSQKERNPSSTQMVFEYAAKLVGEKIHPLLGKAFGLLAPGGITDNIKQEHTLQNFNEVFVQKMGNVKDKDGQIIPLEQVYSGIQPIAYDKTVAAELEKMKKENGNIGAQKFSMANVDKTTGKLTRLEFSDLELKKAFTKTATQFKEKITPKPTKELSEEKAADSKLSLASVKEALFGKGLSK